ncbi:M42 family metallopeptidase [Jannaschia sp. CCS1]|uniref:M42 family metallopeptidase n=1 Tax=Jannaschia sp. (strain CCS1) TaxID=290400 RepID=UPI000053BA99|nr:M20/M25/M40 family metallo-hydrolase [Jannaschia sp. CCS1]ABD55030.1 peptidase M42 [Jannaschia sp. CCS1]
MIADDLKALMMIPGLSGHEGRVAAAIAARMPVECRTDTMGNLIATFPGQGPSVMLFTHMDQLGLIVRKIDDDGLIRVHRMGGVPERALPSQSVVLSTPDGRDISGVLANKSHHATGPDEKYTVLKAADLFIDTGHGSKAAVEAAGIRIGTPVTYAPNVVDLEGGRIAGTSVDDRAGCAVLLDVAAALARRDGGPPVHVVFSTQEEFNLRGAVVAAQALQPDIAIQIDLMLACDTPDMAGQGEMALGEGPGMSLYSFHGRGTLNGVLPHPALVALFDETASSEDMALQRSAQIGVLTDLSYVQSVGHGVASIDLGFPMRYSHSSLEMCQISDLEALSRLLVAGLARIGPDFPLERWA